MAATETDQLRTYLEQHASELLLPADWPKRLDNGHSSEALQALYRQALHHAEGWLIQEVFSPSAVTTLQALYREQAAWISQSTEDRRHHIVITIPVADRPQQLERCLQSLVTLCQQFHYGRNSEGWFNKVSLLIADDSLQPENQQAIRRLTAEMERHGINAHYFGNEEQQALLTKFPEAALQPLQQTIPRPQQGQHNGASTTRNLAYLKLDELSKTRYKGEPLLFWFVDSDQEFRINLPQPEGEYEPYCINYLFHFDQIFHQHNPIMVTGKLVGDPPVSPTVMAGNLLYDLNHFLQHLHNTTRSSGCPFHQPQSRREGEAAYHDMTDLFGYPLPDTPYPFLCREEGEHTMWKTLHHFTHRLDAFFYGEHPTRRAYHAPQPLEETIQPARTVYTANYIFTPEGLQAFIPFAALKLRMAGPMLGRFLQQQWGDRFLSANLPMVHKRTLDQQSRAEHRPGVEATIQQIDLSTEFERQFYGDVMLFSIIQLCEAGFPQQTLPHEQLMEQLQITEQQIRTRYLQQRETITERLQQLNNQWKEESGWWHSVETDSAMKQFSENLSHNFLKQATVWQQIEDPQHRAQRLTAIASAIFHYREDQQAWQALLKR